jgi:hypothetical protein
MPRRVPDAASASFLVQTGDPEDFPSAQCARWSRRHSIDASDRLNLTAGLRCTDDSQVRVNPITTPAT